MPPRRSDDDPIFAPPEGWRRNYWDPLYGDPWMGEAVREAYRERRHEAWRAALSRRDRARIRAAIDAVGDNYNPPTLEDLDASSIRIGFTRAAEARHYSGEVVGTARDGYVAIMVWVK